MCRTHHSTLSRSKLVLVFHVKFSPECDDVQYTSLNFVDLGSRSLVFHVKCSPE